MTCTGSLNRAPRRIAFGLSSPSSILPPQAGFDNRSKRQPQPAHEKCRRDPGGPSHATVWNPRSSALWEVLTCWNASRSLAEKMVSERITERQFKSRN